MDITEIIKETVQDKLTEMLDTIAHNNYDFICSTCLELKEQIIELAGEILGSDTAETLEKLYEYTVDELRAEIE